MRSVGTKVTIKSKSPRSRPLLTKHGKEWLVLRCTATSMVAVSTKDGFKSVISAHEYEVEDE